MSLLVWPRPHASNAPTMVATPSTASHMDVLKGASSDVHKIEVSSIIPGEIGASAAPSMNLKANKPPKLKDAATNTKRICC